MFGSTSNALFFIALALLVIPLGLEGAHAPSRVYVHNPLTPLKGGISWVRALTNGEKTKDRPIKSVFFHFVIPLGLEPKTYSLEGCCSIQLSYGTIFTLRCPQSVHSLELFGAIHSRSSAPLWAHKSTPIFWFMQYFKGPNDIIPPPKSLLYNLYTPPIGSLCAVFRGWCGVQVRCSISSTWAPGYKIRYNSGEHPYR